MRHDSGGYAKHSSHSQPLMQNRPQGFVTPDCPELKHVPKKVWIKVMNRRTNRKWKDKESGDYDIIHDLDDFTGIFDTEEDKLFFIVSDHLQHHLYIFHCQKMPD